MHRKDTDLGLNPSSADTLNYKPNALARVVLALSLGVASLAVLAEAAKANSTPAESKSEQSTSSYIITFHKDGANAANPAEYVKLPGSGLLANIWLTNTGELCFQNIGNTNARCVLSNIDEISVITNGDQSAIVFVRGGEVYIVDSVSQNESTDDPSSPDGITYRKITLIEGPYHDSQVKQLEFSGGIEVVESDISARLKTVYAHWNLSAEDSLEITSSLELFKQKLDTNQAFQSALKSWIATHDEDKVIGTSLKTLLDSNELTFPDLLQRLTESGGDFILNRSGELLPAYWGAWPVPEVTLGNTPLMLQATPLHSANEAGDEREMLMTGVSVQELQHNQRIISGSRCLFTRQSDGTLSAPDCSPGVIFARFPETTEIIDFGALSSAEGVAMQTITTVSAVGVIETYLLTLHYDNDGVLTSHSFDLISFQTESTFATQVLALNKFQHLRIESIDGDPRLVLVTDRNGNHEEIEIVLPPGFPTDVSQVTMTHISGQVRISVKSSDGDLTEITSILQSHRIYLPKVEGGKPLEEDGYEVVYSGGTVTYIARRGPKGMLLDAHIVVPN